MKKAKKMFAAVAATIMVLSMGMISVKFNQDHRYVQGVELLCIQKRHMVNGVIRVILGSVHMDINMEWMKNKKGQLQLLQVVQSVH